MSQPTVSGIAPTTGITLSDEDLGENARSAAYARNPGRAQPSMLHPELVILRMDLGSLIEGRAQDQGGGPAPPGWAVAIGWRWHGCWLPRRLPGRSLLREVLGQRTHPGDHLHCADAAGAS